MNLLPIDELNILTENLSARGQITEADTEDIIDELLDLLLLAYYNGSTDAAEMLGIEVIPDLDDAREVINRKIAGKDFEERVREYTPGGKTADILRVAETDMTRVYNEAVLTVGRKYGAEFKTWQTMEDNRVRDTHDFLLGMTVPIDAEFYTYDDDHAQAPGGFMRPQNNVNCRCYLIVS